MNSPDIQQQLATAVAFHRRGEFDEAAALYQILLAREPNLPEANHNLGQILLKQGQSESALLHFQRALVAAPRVGLYWLSFVEGLLAVDRPREALEILEDVIARGLDLPEARQLLKHVQARQAAASSGSETRKIDAALTQNLWTLSLADDVQICVPAALHSLTTYVLLEQENWFEPELAFLRQWIKPGMNILDLGANYGVYTLSLARGLAGRGTIIACEPAERPAALLARGILANAYESIVTLRRVVCAERSGTCEMPLVFDRALHRHDDDSTLPRITVRAITLDELLEDPCWPSGQPVDMLKLDGAEICALQGGSQFFVEQDPLILFDCRHRDLVNTALLAAFTARGFQFYRLVPGLNALLAVADSAALDPYQLKLFACKPTRAERLRAEGWLIDAAAPEDHEPVHHWRERLMIYPYTAAPIDQLTLLAAWHKLSHSEDIYWPAYESALDAWLSAADPQQPLHARWQWLQSSRKQLIDLRLKGDHHLTTILLSIRVFAACGERAAAVHLNRILAKALERGVEVSFDRPFVPPAACYDNSVPMDGLLGPWIQAAIIESLEQLEFYSSYFHLDAARLRKLDNNPNRSMEFDRRRVLCLAATDHFEFERFTPALLTDKQDHFPAWQAIADLAAAQSTIATASENDSGIPTPHEISAWCQAPFSDSSPQWFQQATAASTIEERADLLLRCIGTNRDFVPAYLDYAALLLTQKDEKTALIALKEAHRLAPVSQQEQATIAALERDFPEYRDYLEKIGATSLKPAVTPWRILVVTNLLPPQEMGGFGRTIWEFCRLLLLRGHQLRILTADMPHLYREPSEDIGIVENHVCRCLKLHGDWKQNGIVFDPYRKSVFLKIAENEQKIITAARDFQPDFCLIGNLDLLCYNFITALIELNIPIIHRLGNGFPGYPSHAVPRSDLYCLAAASAWLNRHLAEKGYDYRRTSVIYPGATLTGFYRYFLPVFDYLRICFAGLLMPYKGAHVLTSALAFLHEWGVPFTCEFAGDTTDPSYIEQMKTLATERGFFDQIRFIGFLNRKELAGLYARCNVMVFPSSFNEPFGKSQIEAMAAGLVVVSSATGGAAEIIIDEVNGLQFQREEASDLARQLQRLSQNPEWAKSLARRAQQDAFHFTTENSIAKLEALAAELLEVRKNRI